MVNLWDYDQQRAFSILVRSVVCLHHPITMSPDPSMPSSTMVSSQRTEQARVCCARQGMRPRNGKFLDERISSSGTYCRNDPDRLVRDDQGATASADREQHWRTLWVPVGLKLPSHWDRFAKCTINMSNSIAACIKGLRVFEVFRRGLWHG